MKTTWIIAAVLAAACLGAWVFVAYLEQQPSRQFAKKVDATIDSTNKFIKENAEFLKKAQLQLGGDR